MNIFNKNTANKKTVLTIVEDSVSTEGAYEKAVNYSVELIGDIPSPKGIEKAINELLRHGNLAEVNLFEIKMKEK